MKKIVSMLAVFAVMLLVPLSLVHADPPHMSVVTPVPTPASNQTPSFTFKSTQQGTLEYVGDCKGDKDQISGDSVPLTVKFDKLNPGVHDNCKIILHYTEWAGYVKFLTETLDVPAFKILILLPPMQDFTAPVLTQVTAVPSPSTITTPSYTFHSNEAGDITVGGACASTMTKAVVGNNTITFNKMAFGTYTSCTIVVTDASTNASKPLSVPSFKITGQVLTPVDTTAPELKMQSAVATPTTDTTPNLTFWSSEAGSITYTGSCASDTVDAVSGNNTITLKTLATGTYNNCHLLVTDAANNASAWLAIPSFTITNDSYNPPVNPPANSTNYCSGFVDVSATDSDCEAIKYVKSIGAMTGNPNGTFEPSAKLQRDQVAKISLETFNLFNATGNYCSGLKPFPDVTSSSWAYQYICRGVNLGMITGYDSGADAGYYRPARSVNRVEFLALMLRNVDEKMPNVNSVSYKDVEKGSWFSGYAKFSYDNSLFTGSSLNPGNFVSRREVARVIYQLNQLGKI